MGRLGRLGRLKRKIKNLRHLYKNKYIYETFLEPPPPHLPIYQFKRDLIENNTWEVINNMGGWGGSFYYLTIY